jgi:hypothetical protein
MQRCQYASGGSVGIGARLDEIANDIPLACRVPGGRAGDADHRRVQRLGASPVSGPNAGPACEQVSCHPGVVAERRSIAFSSYPSQPPADSVFGRPGQGVSLQSGQTVKAGQQVACVNPAALGGGTGDLDPYLLTSSRPGLSEPAHTPWVTYPDLYSASCRQGGGASWLQVTSLAGTSHARPVVNEDKVGTAIDTGPAWGYHGYEYGLALGNLLQDVAGAEAAWEARH